MIFIPNRYDKAIYEDVPKDIREFLENDDNNPSVYIQGVVGTGKTHVAYALAKKHYEINKYTQFWNVTELLFEIKRDFNREENLKKTDNLLSFSGLLFLDDIGAEKPTEFVAETLYMIINNRYNNTWPTIFTSNLSLAELAERIGDRSASRIAEMCQVFTLTGKDRRLNKI